MTADKEKPLTLSREDLYELVWSKPMQELAKDFGLSDVALAKRCRRLAIPVPGRGYWARLNAGQHPYRPQLPSRQPQRLDAGALTVGPSRDRGIDYGANALKASEGSVEGPSTAQLDAAWLQDRLKYEEQPDNAITVPATTREWDETIQRCRDELEEAAESLRASKKASDRYEKLPQWRKHAQVNDDGYAWRMVRDCGQRLCDTHKAVCFRVSLGTYLRALAIVNALALAARPRGFTVREDKKKGRIVFAGHSAEVQLRLTELLDPKTRPTTRYDGKVEQEKYYMPTGRLRITLQIGYWASSVFEDRDSHPLESQLNRVFRGIHRQVVRAWRAERKHQASRREFEEDARQRAETARLQAQRRRAAVAARARRRRLTSEASLWRQANLIRDYVAHVGARAGDPSQVYGELSEWMAWALSVATELDPSEARLSPIRAGSH